MNIKSFKIEKLHGVLNYELKFENNNLILIGENGSCKTTIMKMLFYTLSMQWAKLSQYNFDFIKLKFDEEDLRISKKDIGSIIVDNKRFLRRFPPHIREELINIIRHKGVDYGTLSMISKRYGISMNVILREFDLEEELFSENKSSSNFKNVSKKISKAMNGIHVIYLPTYRRIEQELKVVLDGRFEDDNYRTLHRRSKFENTNFSELVEFGMDDVEISTNNAIERLRDFFTNSLNQMTFGYLSDVIDKKYNQVQIELLSKIDEKTVTNIMQRVDEKILSSDSKHTLIKIIEKVKNSNSLEDYDRVVCHYFNKLLATHQELEQKEEALRNFSNIIGKYLKNKEIKYDSSNFSFRMTSNIENKEITFNQLSSGEKQIVSLFSHLYLDGDKKYLVLIDEPELSLSVKWQKIFLEDINSGDFCIGVIAVTHSPFIFDNSLDKYAHSIEEFIK